MSMQAALTTVLEEDQLVYELSDEGDHLRVRSLAQSGEWVVIGQWSEADAQLAVYCVCTLVVPEPLRISVMELVTRANFGLRLGCFELDLDDGELRFRASADLEGTEAQPATARALLYTAVATMNRYLPALIDVIDGKEPKVALTAIERSS
jgi:hypothetical protein